MSPDAYREPPPSPAVFASARVFGVAAMLLFIGAVSPAAHARQLSAEAEAGRETGDATYYSQRFEGRRTASGQTFRHSELMAAHPSHPFGTLVRVTNLRNGSWVDVRIADRGGFGKRGGKLIIDLSRTAAARLDMISGGRARVIVEVLGRAEQRVKAAVEPPQITASAD